MKILVIKLINLFILNTPKTGTLANSVDPAQTPSSGSTVFALNTGTYIIHCFNNITKTCLYNMDPLKPHFYIVKLGFTGLYIIFLIYSKNIDCGYSLEPPRRGGSNKYDNLFLFLAKI